MPQLIIRQHRSPLMPRLPHLILINGQLIGQMQQDEVRIDMPAGLYEVRIQSLIRWFSATQRVKIDPGVQNLLSFRDREGVWDALFVVDIVLEVVSYFLTLARPWNIIYKCFTWGYLLLWLLYEWAIRKKYFHTEFHHLPSPSTH